MYVGGYVVHAILYYELSAHSVVDLYILKVIFSLDIRCVGGCLSRRSIIWHTVEEVFNIAKIKRSIWLGF